jgi:tol-pal system protein YbgF
MLTLRQVSSPVRTALVAMLAAATSLSAHAQLFPDNEARRAILEIREKADADRKLLTESSTRVAEQIQQMQRSLLELNNQVETLRGELAKQRGQNEQLTRDLTEAQRKLRDMTQQMADDKSALQAAMAAGAAGGGAGAAASGAAAAGSAARNAPAQPTLLRVLVDGREITVESDEKKQYDDAINFLRQGDYPSSSNALVAFQKRWPSSGYIDASRFWLGNAQYGRREYKESLATFKGFVSAAPDHPRVPEAMLAMANAHLELKDTRSARTVLSDLVRLHPRTEAATAGKERLAALR